MKTVCQFKTLDPVTGEMVIQPVKSTAERIGQIADANIVAGSGERVPASTVDADGRRKFRV